MKVKRWSRTDQVFLEGLLYAAPSLVLLAVWVRVFHAVRGDALEVTGPLPDALAPPVEGVVGPLSGTLTVQDPGAHVYAWDLLPLLLALAVTTAAAVLLLGVARGLREGDPFTTANARRLTSLAVLVVVGGFTVQWFHAISQDALLAAALPGQDRTSVFEMSFWYVPAGALVFFLAEVFARGARLREDLEGLV